MTVLADTFRPLSEVTATVQATVEGPAPGRWLLLLTYEQGSWKVIATSEVTS